MTRRSAALAAAALAAAALAGSARAETSAEVRALAERARNDADALVELRAVREVDGAPVDLAAALDTEGADLGRRLDALVASLGDAPPTVDPEAASADAREILSQRRYRGSDVPRPFRGLLEWLGEKLSPLGRPFRWVDEHVPGGGWIVWTLLALVVIALAAVVSGRVARRRGGVLAERARRSRFARREDPDALERAADEAERSGDLERALRLRFRAGIVRLARRGAIPPRESLTSGEIRRLLRLPDFDRLARTFDEVVYGGRTARADDVADARERWPRVVEQAPAR